MMNKCRQRLPKQKLKGNLKLRERCIRCGTELSVSAEDIYCNSCRKKKDEWAAEKVNVWKPDK